MIDGARYYENEVQVGVGVRQSGVKREDVFISEDISSRSSWTLASHLSGLLCHVSFQGLPQRFHLRRHDSCFERLDRESWILQVLYILDNLHGLQDWH
jgi:hypothetical protein